MTKPIIYILEDSAELSNALLQSVRRYLDVVQFESPQVLLSKIDSGALPCLVISDCHMPSMSGIELCNAIAARNISLPVILMSGWVDKEIALAAVRAGAIDFLEKPFTITQWVRSILRGLQVHIDQKIQRERFRYHSQLVQVQSDLLNLYEKRFLEAENLVYSSGQPFPKDKQNAPEFIKTAHLAEKLQHQISELQRNLKKLTEEEADAQTVMILAPTKLNE